MNITVHDLLNYFHSLLIYTKEWNCYIIMVVLFLVFWETSTLFSIVSISIYIPTNSTLGFPFLHILTSIYYFVIFLMTAILTSVRWSLIVFLICISDDQQYWIPSHVPFGHLYAFFGKISIQALFIFWLGCLFLYWVVWGVHIFWILTPWWSFQLQVFFFHSLLFYFFQSADGYLCCAKVFKFRSHLFTFAFVFFFCIKVWLIYNVSLISVMQNSNPVTHNSLCCTVAVHCLFIVHWCYSLYPPTPNSPSIPLSTPTPWQSQVCSPFPWSVSVL